MNEPKSQFTEITEDTFSSTCSSFLDAVQILRESGMNDGADMLVNITNATLFIQQRMTDLLCPHPGINETAAYACMKESAERLLLAIECLGSPGRPCIECRHYMDVSGTSHCASPRNRLLDLVYGTEKQIEPHCKNLRHTENASYCGIYGRWFEQKEQEEKTLN